MKKILSIIILGLLLEGCATQGKYRALLDTWVGLTEDQLVDVWGPPNGLYNKKDGGRILTFAWSGSYYLPGDTSTSSSSTHDGVVTTTTTVSPGSYITTGCKTNFYISAAGKITTWDFRGNNCVSNYKKLDEGKITKKFPSGAKYVGFLKDGRANGQGTYTNASGQKYVGEFKDGDKHGQGTQTFPGGEKYVGEWKDSAYNGQGTFIWADGGKYVGEFKDGKRHGQGNQTYADGTKDVGEWKDGKFIK